MAIAGFDVKGSCLNHSSLGVNKPVKAFSSNPFLCFSNSSRKSPQKGLCLSLDSSASAIVSPSWGEDTKTRDAVFSEKIDSWMNESVIDIVKNLKQAPLLVQVYSENDGVNGNRKVKLRTQKAIEEDWPAVKREWESGKTKSPHGLIFVEELEQNCVDNDNGNDSSHMGCDQGVEEGVTRAWGIVVQGKGVECGPACYLLKTSKVAAGIGLGLFCTHFCLVRVKNFKDSALEQFKDSWLLE